MSDVKPENMSAGQRPAVLIILLVVVSLLATGFIWAQNKVHITADGKTTTLSTIYRNPEQILAKAGIVLQPKDEFRLSTPEVVNDTTILVYRAMPVSITYQGETRDIVSGKPTVAEAVTAAGIADGNVRLDPAGETPLAPGLNIRVLTVREETVDQEVVEAFTIVRQPDPTMEKGSEEIVSEGQDGKKQVKIRVRYEDGQQVSTQVLEEKVLAASQPQIVKAGVRDTVETSRGTMRFRSVRTMEASAYTPYDGSAAGLTATGVPARRGVVAVDPAVIPLGSRVYVTGYGLALAADTGGAIIGDRIDLCMESHGEAMHFGRRTVRVYILD